MPKFAVKPPATEERNPYLPPGPQDALAFELFEGMNTSTTRPGVDDKQAYWLDGYMPLGNRDLRTLWGVGTPITFAASIAPVAFFQFANIGATPYCISIHTDGSIRATNTNTYSTTVIAAAATITNPSRLNVGLCQYGSQYVLIVSSQTNGYFVWNGTTFYKPGDSFGGGTIPTAISGTAVETYQGRVWIVNGATLTFSAPGSVIDFTTGSGGGNTTSSDSFLRVRYIQLLSTNGFLYLIADSSVNYISGVQTSGSLPTTTFTNQNADPEVGTPWPSTVGTFGRNIVFANAFGAHISYGAAVTKVSEPLDGVYNTVANFGSFIPSAAKAIIFGKKIWMLLIPIVDPVTGQQVNKLMLWNEQRKWWWASGQDVALSYVQSQEIDSVLTAWGSTGNAIYPLFQRPSTGFAKTAQSKLWDKPGGYLMTKTTGRLWGMVQYYSIDSPELTISIDNENSQADNEVSLSPNMIEWTNNAGNPIVWTNNLGDPITWFSLGTGIVVMPPQSVGQQGSLLGYTVETTAADMALISLAMLPQISGYRG